MQLTEFHVAQERGTTPLHTTVPGRALEETQHQSLTVILAKYALNANSFIKLLRYV
jgi:hypothetical protein